MTSDTYPPSKPRTKRLSFDLPEDVHTRFKTVCARLRKRMNHEMIKAVEQRVQELEKLADEADLTFPYRRRPR